MKNKMFPNELKLGSHGPAVQMLQVILILLKKNSCIVVDGEFGEETQRGLCVLQDYAGLEATGSFGEKDKDYLKRRFDLDLDALESFGAETNAPKDDPKQVEMTLAGVFKSEEDGDPGAGG